MKKALCITTCIGIGGKKYFIKGKEYKIINHLKARESAGLIDEKNEEHIVTNDEGGWYSNFEFP